MKKVEGLILNKSDIVDLLRDYYGARTVIEENGRFIVILGGEEK